MKLFALAASIRNKKSLEYDFVEANCALAETGNEALEWFAGHIELKYPPHEGFCDYVYDAVEVPDEMR